ncbi:MAG: amidohydrolase family protein, partial [Maricaulis sp.]
DIEAFAGQDWVMTASDGSTGHPRRFATFPKAYRDLVVDGGMMSLERFVRRSTGLTADTFGFTGRGYLREGYIADIVVFDPQSFAPRAGYAAPEELSEGVRYLLVNGALAIENGATTGALAGQPVLRDTSHIDLCEE